jgi:beta-aspartyl-dipeptidase (metallo-type)
MLLIKNIDIYAPERMGIKDVLIAGEQIVEISENIEPWSENIRIIDGSGKKMMPGFIDQHVHITGGGGEGSFRTRVPEITLSKIVESGITTVVGLLGTDGSTRSVENVVAKAKALKEEGISVYALTGSYGYPSVNLSGSVKKDICFIDEILGCKLAISDHRCPNISIENLSLLASDVRIGGMMSGKAGILTLHLGDSPEGINPILEVLEKTELPVTTMRPTHVNRKAKLLDQSFEYAKMGGYIDLTCGLNEELRPSVSVLKSMENGVPQENITISSDGNGSAPVFDDRGNMVKIGVGSVKSLYEEFKEMVSEHGMEVEDALIYFTSNVAKGLSLYPKKGSIAAGSDADLLIIDDDLNIDCLVCRGKVALEDREVVIFGCYE